MPGFLDGLYQQMQEQYSNPNQFSTPIGRAGMGMGLTQLGQMLNPGPINPTGLASDIRPGAEGALSMPETASSPFAASFGSGLQDFGGRMAAGASPMKAGVGMGLSSAGSALSGLGAGAAGGGAMSSLGSGMAKGAGGLMSLLGGLFSDEKLKKNISQGDRNISGFLDAIGG